MRHANRSTRAPPDTHTHTHLHTPVPPQTAIMAVADVYTTYGDLLLPHTDVGGQLKPTTSLLAQMLLKCSSNDKKFVIEEAQRAMQVRGGVHAGACGEAATLHLAHPPSRPLDWRASAAWHWGAGDGGQPERGRGAAPAAALCRPAQEPQGPRQGGRRSGGSGGPHAAARRACLWPPALAQGGGQAGHRWVLHC